MPPNTDAYVASSHSVSDQQLIPQATKSVSMPESSCKNTPVLHPRQWSANTLMLNTCTNTIYDDGEGGRATSGHKKNRKGKEINGGRFAATERRCYSSKTNDVLDIAHEDNDESSDASDEESVDSTQEWHGIKIYNDERRENRCKMTGRKEQCPKKKNLINHFTGSFVLFVSTIHVLLACPEIITSVCRCEDSQNGIILECSYTNGSQVVHTLKANQINLGLIQHLEMQNSGLEHIPAGFFSGLFIKKLDISYNSILDIAENSFLGMNDVLQELILHHNNLTQLPSKALTPLSALLRLDLSNNSIGDIEAEHAFPPLPKLYDINLANNRIYQIHKNVFDDVKHSVKTINLGRNYLESVPAPAIRGMKQLKALHLHNNNISSLEALSFMNLPMVDLLNLASNQISTIHNRAFLNVPNLRYLYLTRNRINNISPHQFSSFEQLEMLDLTGNHLTVLQENSFSNLKNLRQLYLGENRIRNIKSRSFTNSSVVILILNSNQLGELQEGMFDGLNKLQQLGLKDNQIRSIHQNSFYSNPDLAKLDLSNNKLVDIPHLSFLTQNNLFFIDLSGNKLERTPYEAFSRRTTMVLLQENPLVCSEGVHMLQHGVGIYISSSEDVICGSNRKPNRNGNITDMTNALSNSTHFTVDNEDSNFKQREKLLQPKPPAVIRPLSSISNEENKPEASVGKQNKMGTNKVDPLRSVNPTINVQQLSQISSSEQSTHATGGRASTVSAFRIFENKVPEDREMRGRNISRNHHTFDTNNIIHPFPVPFLKRPSKLSKAYITASRTTTTMEPTSASNWASDEQTLPPSIVVASHVQESDHTSAKKIGMNQINTNPTQNTREAQSGEERIFFDLDNTERLERVTTPSVIILICLSTVAIVMAAALVGLCIAKHRRLQTYHDSMTSSSATRTNAYVAAQLDMIYGTVRRNRNVPMPNRFDDSQPWIYSPTSYGINGYYK